MDKWENAAKDRAKARAEKEKEITQVLEKLNEATKKNEESSLASELAKLTQRSTELKQQTDKIEAWQVTFNEEQKQIFREQDRRWQKS
eukprot:6640617-Ditylum_brightwellii.AAC.2